MTRRWQFLSLGLGMALAALMIASCGGGDNGTTGGSPDVSVFIVTPTGATQTPSRRTATPTPSPSPTPLVICGTNPDPASPKVLQIQEPFANQQVRVPIHVSGWGSNIGLQDLGVALAVVDAKQTVQQVLKLPPQPRTFRVAPQGLDVNDNTRPFAADVIITGIKEPTPFCLWVYQQTTESGQPRGVVQLPIIVVP